MSFAELDENVWPCGSIGIHLVSALDRIVVGSASIGRNLGEVYIPGDSPLVLLTALQSQFEPDPSSSRYEELPAPRIDADGRYVEDPAGRPIRVYTQIDNRLMFGDLVAKPWRVG
jgi:hypothetical protein